MVAESLPEHLEQTVAVYRFFRAHLFEHLCRRWILVPQRVRELPVNAAVFLFRGNRDRQNFFFRQILELFQHRSLSSDSCAEAESHKPSREVILRPEFHGHEFLPTTSSWPSGVPLLRKSQKIF